MEIINTESVKEMIAGEKMIKLIKVQNALKDVIEVLGKNDGVREVIDEIEVEINRRTQNMEKRITW